MNRRHLVELEDLPWFPAVLRDGGTAYLHLAVALSGHAKKLVPPLRRALERTGSTHLVDCCSGGGGPVRLVADALAAEGVAVHVTLTDLYPNAAAFAHASKGAEDRVKGRLEPVDATAVPSELKGFRTMFNAFHHLPPELAKKALANAVAARQPIGIFEVVSREPAPLIGILLAPLLVTLTVPFWRPFRPAWLLWTWLLPVMQAFIVFDGVVSWLRIYSEPELRALVADIPAPDWTWEIGKIPLGGPANATYLIGMPG